MRSEYIHVAQDIGKRTSRINAVMNLWTFLNTRNFLAELTTLDSKEDYFLDLSGYTD
jgi:hypothetical protein